MNLRICIVGAFGFETLPTGGQPVKTRNLFRLLSESYGKESTSYIETYGWKRHPLKIAQSIAKAVKRNDAIIMLPAHNGVRVFAPLLIVLSKKKKVKLFYDVIGGWLPEKTANSRSLTKQLKCFDGIWVETSSMKSALEKQNFKNVIVVPNFKYIEPLDIKYLLTPEKPYKLCTFSRVMQEKGIEDAVTAVIAANREANEVLYTLDIYGPIDELYRDRFESLRAGFPSYVRYRGVVQPDQSVKVLKEYFSLLFPTHFDTEGVPGTVLDAYAAGVPVIAAKWKNCGDVLLDEVTGWSYEMGDICGLQTILTKIPKNAKNWITIRGNCIKQARRFSAEVALCHIQKSLEGTKNGA